MFSKPVKEMSLPNSINIVIRNKPYFGYVIVILIQRNSQRNSHQKSALVLSFVYFNQSKNASRPAL